MFLGVLGWVMALGGGLPAQEAVPSAPVGGLERTSAPPPALELWTADGFHPVDGWRDGLPWTGGRARREWLGIRPAAVPPLQDAPWQLELVDGGWLPGSPGLGGGDRGSWRLVGGRAFPFDTLWLARVGRGRLPAGGGGADRDLLWLRHDGGLTDLMRGWLLHWRPEGLVFEGVAGERLLPWERISGLWLLPEDAPVPRLAHPVWVVLAGGGHFSADLRGGLGADGVSLRLPWGTDLTLAWPEIAALYRRGDGLVDLAERPPVLQEGRHEGPVDWRPRRGHSVEGRPLRCGGREYPSGYGCRVPAELAFALESAGSLHLLVGVDDEVLSAQAPRPVRFRVLLDEEELAHSPLLRAGDPPFRFRIRIPRGGRLRLRAEPGEILPFGAHADWLAILFQPEGARTP